MVPLQREIEDERKARLNRIPQTSVESLGCGLTSSWIDFFSAETETPPAEPGYFDLGECVRELSGGLIMGHHQPRNIIIIKPEERVELLRLGFCTRGWNTLGQERTPPIHSKASGRRDRNDTTDTVSRSPAPRFRHRELEWRRTHSAELTPYENQWVVLEGEEIIAHDSDASQAIRQAKSRGIRTPYIFFVEPESDNSVRIGL